MIIPGNDPDQTAVAVDPDFISGLDQAGASPARRPRRAGRIPWPRCRRGRDSCPTSTTAAPAVRKSGVQAGSVYGATRISPGARSTSTEGSMITRATPSYCPGEAGWPLMVPGSSSSWPASSLGEIRIPTVLGGSILERRLYSRRPVPDAVFHVQPAELTVSQTFQFG